jgi:hypothetical protein
MVVAYLFTLGYRFLFIWMSSWSCELGMSGYPRLQDIGSSVLNKAFVNDLPEVSSKELKDIRDGQSRCR